MAPDPHPHTRPQAHTDAVRRRAPHEDPAEALGGADAVEKTTYVDLRRPDGEPPGGGTSVLLWLVTSMALAIGLVYGVGLFI